MRHASLLILAALAGCTETSGSSPSLGLRAVEKIGRDMREPVRPVQAPALADAALRTRIDALTAKVRAGQAAFERLLPQARAAISAAGAEGSESWIAAQQQLTALEGARAPSPGALSDLEALITERLAAGNVAGQTELQAAEADAARVVAAQQDEVDRLRARISR